MFTNSKAVFSTLKLEEKDFFGVFYFRNQIKTRKQGEVMKKAGDYTLEHLKNERDRFVAFAFASADILLELDNEGNIAFADGATHSLLGTKPEELAKTPLTQFIASEDTEFFNKVLGKNSNLKKIDSLKIRLKNQNGELVPFVISGYQIPYLKNHFFLTLSHLKATISSQDIAQRDPHTGLLNREAFAWQALNHAKRITSNDLELEMSMIDISTILQEIKLSDPNGSNSLVEEICDFIKKCSVDGDSAGLIEDGRIGVIHTALITKEDIHKTIATIVSNLDIGDFESCIKIDTVKLDIPSLTESDSTKAVLYTLNSFVKSKGDVSIKSLQDSYRLMLGDTVTKFSEFKRICSDKDFDVAFQPIVSLESNEVHHYEALMRLSEDGDTFKNPFHFITFGEQSGIIPEFDIAMCQKTFGLMGELEADKMPMVSLNLSGISIANPLFQEALKGLLNRNSEYNGYILFEVTESARIDDLVDSNRFLQELREMGNKCCIDDFGAGESSFDYIRQLDVDFIKIDGSYVKDCVKTERGKHLLTAMVQICKDLKIEAIAEMVEDKDAADFLRKVGVHMGQGYFYGSPATDIKKLKPSYAHRSKDIKASNLGVKKLPNPNKSWWSKK